MNYLLTKLVRFLHSEEGTTAIEYAAIVGLIFLAVLSAITAFGQAANDSMVSSAETLGDVLEGS